MYIHVSVTLYTYIYIYICIYSHDHIWTYMIIYVIVERIQTAAREPPTPDSAELYLADAATFHAL